MPLSEVRIFRVHSLRGQKVHKTTDRRIRPLSPLPTPIIHSPLFALRASFRVVPPLSERLEQAKTGSIVLSFTTVHFFFLH